jgi:CelD/BcsL family acetyltransferase involved in cellulose biosynthesis
MKISVVRSGELGQRELERWGEIQRTVPFLDSPYFSPEFVRAAGEVREGVEVAVLEDGGAVVGFFAFERGRGNVGYPVGRSFSDFQAVIAEPETPWDGDELLRGCGLSAWCFDHFLAEQAPLVPFHWSTAPSPYVDLSQGFESYRAERKRAGSKEVEKCIYEGRKAERRAGPVRFEFQTGDDAVFEQLMSWKSAQFLRTGQVDQVAVPWVREFLERLRGVRGESFSSVLSALYFGETLAAAHFGIRSRTALHWWLPSYNAELGSFSPGQISLLETCKAAAELGIHRFDLGKGPEPYKLRLMSGSIPVAQGAIHRRAPVAALWRARYRTTEWVRRSPLRNVLRGPSRWLRRMLASTGS